MLTFGKVATAKIAESELAQGFVSKLLKPNATIKRSDIVGLNIKEFLQDLKNVGVKISQKYNPKNDNFSRNAAETVAQIVETPKGNTVVHLKNVNRGYFGTQPYNVTMAFDKNGEALQLVHSKVNNPAEAVILRTEKGIEKLKKAGVYNPQAYQDSYIDGGKQIISSADEADAFLTGKAIRGDIDLPPIEHPNSSSYSANVREINRHSVRENNNFPDVPSFDDMERAWNQQGLGYQGYNFS